MHFRFIVRVTIANLWTDNFQYQDTMLDKLARLPHLIWLPRPSPDAIYEDMSSRHVYFSVETACRSEAPSGILPDECYCMIILQGSTNSNPAARKSSKPARV